MARAKTKEEAAAFEEQEKVILSTQKWTAEELLAVKHLGPGIIGEEMYKASQAYDAQTGGGKYGPALLGIIPEAYKDNPAMKKKDA